MFHAVAAETIRTHIMSLLQIFIDRYRHVDQPQVAPRGDGVPAVILPTPFTVRLGAKDALLVAHCRGFPDLSRNSYNAPRFCPARSSAGVENPPPP